MNLQFYSQPPGCRTGRNPWSEVGGPPDVARRADLVADRCTVGQVPGVMCGWLCSSPQGRLHAALRREPKLLGFPPCCVRFTLYSPADRYSSIPRNRSATQGPGYISPCGRSRRSLRDELQPSNACAGGMLGGVCQLASDPLNDLGSRQGGQCGRRSAWCRRTTLAVHERIPRELCRGGQSAGVTIPCVSPCDWHMHTRPRSRPLSFVFARGVRGVRTRRSC